MQQVPAGAAEREGRQALRSDRACPPCRRPVARIEARLGDEGRVVLRASGTEPVIRVMVEGRDEADHAGRGRGAGRGGAGRGRLRASPAGPGGPFCTDSPAPARPAAPYASRALHRYHRAPFKRRRRLASRYRPVHAPPHRCRKLEDARLARRKRAADRGAAGAAARRSRQATCVVCPPFVYLQEVGAPAARFGASSSGRRMCVRRRRAPSPAKCRRPC